MYVLQSDQCGMRNSETPMTQAAIDRQDRFVARVGQRFQNGNAALSNLIAALGGNPATVAVGDAGVPAGVISDSVPYVGHGTRVIRLPGWPGPWPVGGLFSGKNFAWPTAGGFMSPSAGFPVGPLAPGSPGVGLGDFGAGAAPWGAAFGPGSASAPGGVQFSGPAFGGAPAGWPASISAGFPGLVPDAFPCSVAPVAPNGGPVPLGPAVAAAFSGGPGLAEASGVSAWWALLLLIGGAMFVDGVSKRQ
jgi:hypothetical protein